MPIKSKLTLFEEMTFPHDTLQEIISRASEEQCKLFNNLIKDYCSYRGTTLDEGDFRLENHNGTDLYYNGSELIMTVYPGKIKEKVDIVIKTTYTRMYELNYLEVK